jgi:hydrogenase-1 operon protein HyaE
MEENFLIQLVTLLPQREAAGMAIALFKKKGREGFMPSPLLRSLSERHRIAVVDENSIEAFLARVQNESAHALLFFAGDPRQRSETHDVAVILPQLLEAFSGRLRGALVAHFAEDLLKGRFHVSVFPSLVVTRGGEQLGVLPKVYDWSDYLSRIEKLLRPEAPVLSASSGPGVQFTFSGGQAR